LKVTIKSILNEFLTVEVIKIMQSRPSDGAALLFLCQPKVINNGQERVEFVTRKFNSLFMLLFTAKN